MKVLKTKELSIAYEDKLIVQGLNVDFSAHKITAIIGANGCGKSTILKTISRLHPATKGAVYLNGKMIHEVSTKEVAKQMAILPQSPEVVSGLTVYELVSFGRTPYLTGFSKLSEKDRKIISWALRVTGITDLQTYEVDQLSGGQRQRAWIAMAIAQETDLLILDEPTTYLDLAHQLEILQLLKSLNENEKRTIIMVLHDLNHAARFADEIIAIKNGKIAKQGSALDVIAPSVLKEVFNIESSVMIDERSGKPALLSYDLVAR